MKDWLEIIERHSGELLRLARSTAALPWRFNKLREQQGWSTGFFCFAVIVSLLLGMLIQLASMPEEYQDKYFSAQFFSLGCVAVGVYWLIFAALIHLVCTSFRGGADFGDTIVETLRILAGCYLAGSAVALLWSHIVSAMLSVGWDLTDSNSLLGLFAAFPRWVYLPISHSLFIVYLGLHLRRVHWLGPSRTVAVVTVAFTLGGFLKMVTTLIELFPLPFE